MHKSQAHALSILLASSCLTLKLRLGKGLGTLSACTGMSELILISQYINCGNLGRAILHLLLQV